MSLKLRRELAVLFIVLVAVCSALLWKYIGTPLLRFISDPAYFRDWVDDRMPYSCLIFCAMVIFQVLLAVIPGEPFEIAAGYAFGSLDGTVLTLIGAVAGSMLTFWLVRKFGMRLVRVFFSEEKIASVRFLRSSAKRDLIFLIVYMLPGSPKDLLGYVAGLTDIRFPTWLVICTLGRLPSLVSSAVCGAALGTKNYVLAAIVFSATFGVSIVGLLIYNHISKKRRENI